MKKISVILPAYKAEKTIRDTIESVKNQTYKNIELIIIENGPKDSTESIIKTYKNSGLDIKYFYSEKPSVSNARNIGIKNSTGEYIAFIDSDDRYECSFLAKMVAYLECNCSQLVSCGYKTSDNKTIRLVKQYDIIKTTNDIQVYLETLKSNLLFNELWNKLYLSSIIKENGILFDEKYELGEDYLFNLEYLYYTEKACYINEPLYIYTVSDDGLKLKYRKDKFDIEYRLTQILKEYYLKKGYSMDFVNNQFARIYYNGIIDIYKSNNLSNRKEKDEQLKEFISRKEYKDDLKSLKDNVTDKKFKFAIKYFFLKGKGRIKFFVLLNKLFHQ
ncbi:MAG: glycosyltransferase family 2 protein [Clostridia bacterium]|nr:glycosyltransferase family 2 protein [Clostridia bacterium]